MTIGTLRLHPTPWTQQNDVIESLITEAINIYSNDMYYIPRHLVGNDPILGEDRLAEFKNAYLIQAYMENADGGFEGQQAFASKFGLQMEQSATLTIARKRWQALVGDFDTGTLPDRPCEGDLLYFPLTGGLFEVMFVQHQDPFYQVGHLYVYKLNVELFRYSSERINTGIPEIDVFEDLKSFDPNINPDPDVPQNYGDNTKLDVKASEHFFDANNPFGSL